MSLGEWLRTFDREAPRSALDELLADLEPRLKPGEQRFIRAEDMTPEQWAAAMGKDPRAPAGRPSLFSATPDPASFPTPD